MATVEILGPADHGRPMTLDEFMAGDYQPGYQYELIDGRLYVSPQPNAPAGHLERWINLKLQRYADARPDIINYVYNKARVFVPGRRGVTNPEPDAAAYHDFPVVRRMSDLHWEDLSPVLVVEVLSADDPDKDLVRNVTLYHQVPTIKEYWVLDSRADPDRPSMRIYKRHGKSWRIIDLAYGDTYTTRLLPGFKLCVDPYR